MSSFRNIFTNFLIFGILLFGIFTLHNCDEYSDTEVVLKVVFYDSNFHETDTSFDKVYGVGGSGEVSKTTPEDEISYYRLPLSVNADSSVFYFEKNGNKEILGISYNREFKFLSEYQGMQITYTDVEIMDITTFERVYINLYNCWIESSNECYTIEIYLF